MSTIAASTRFYTLGQCQATVGGATAAFCARNVARGSTSIRRALAETADVSWLPQGSLSIAERERAGTPAGSRHWKEGRPRKNHAPRFFPEAADVPARQGIL